MRHIHHLDLNQAELVRQLRQLGYSVQSLAMVGGGCPDLLLARSGRNLLLELKHGKAKLNALQLEWHAAWKGQVAVARTLEEALEGL